MKKVTILVLALAVMCSCVFGQYMGNSNSQSGVQQSSRRSNSNSQSGVQQFGGSNSNSQSGIQQASRRSNSNSQSGVQQSGGNNSNSQSGIQQASRRSNSNSQSGVQQSGGNNSNSQSGIQQASRRSNSNSQSGVQQFGSGNSNSQMSVQQSSGRRSNSNSQSGVQQSGGSNSNSQSGVQQFGDEDFSAYSPWQRPEFLPPLNSNVEEPKNSVADSSGYANNGYETVHQKLKSSKKKSRTQSQQMNSYGGQPQQIYGMYQGGFGDSGFQYQLYPRPSYDGRQGYQVQYF